MVLLTEFSSILDLINKFPTEESCIKHLEEIRWDGNVVSPFEPTSKVYACKGNKYKCKSSGKYFNVRTGTIFEDTKMPLQKWFIALYVFSSHKKGISSHQLAKDLDITQKTAWFVLHRLRYAFDHPVFKAQMETTVEIDETYVGGKEGNKHKSKRTKDTQGRSTDTKAIVFGAVERGGNVNAQVIPSAGTISLNKAIKSAVKPGAVVISDAYRGYWNVKNKYQHLVVDHSKGEYVKGMAHTNTIEGFWSQFKRGVYGIYHQVSQKHLQSYVNEFALRYNSRKVCASSRFNLVLSNMVGRLTYEELIREGSF